MDPAALTVSLRTIEIKRHGEYVVSVSDGLNPGDVVCDRRCAGVASWSAGPLARVAAMSGFNLSEWALKHRSITIYLMIVAVLAGLASYYRLGRSEDPSFIIKTMVVQGGMAWRDDGRDDEAGDRAA